jgi:hypothetical protein
MRGSGDALMRSFSSLLRVRSSAHIDSNLGLTPPCSNESRVFGVVGRNDVRADVAAGHPPGELRVSCKSGGETSLCVRVHVPLACSGWLLPSGSGLPAGRARPVIMWLVPLRHGPVAICPE